MDVHRGPEDRHGHRRALGVPARAAGTPRRVPRGMARLAGLPDGHVQRIVLGRVVGPPAVLPGQPQRFGPAEAHPAGHALAAEVDAPLAGVGHARIEEAGCQANDLLHIPVGPRLVFRRAHAQRGHVPVELELLDRGELVVGRPGAAGRRVEHVIDVGDVPAHLRFHAEEAQRAAERVDPHERGCMAEVGDVIGGYPAGIDPGAVQELQPLARDHSRRPTAASVLVMSPVWSPRAACAAPAAVYRPLARDPVAPAASPGPRSPRRRGFR